MITFCLLRGRALGNNYSRRTVKNNWQLSDLKCTFIRQKKKMSSSCPRIYSLPFGRDARNWLHFLASYEDRRDVSVWIKRGLREKRDPRFYDIVEYEHCTVFTLYRVLFISFLVCRNSRNLFKFTLYTSSFGLFMMTVTASCLFLWPGHAFSHSPLLICLIAQVQYTLQWKSSEFGQMDGGKKRASVLWR